MQRDEQEGRASCPSCEMTCGRFRVPTSKSLSGFSWLAEQKRDESEKLDFFFFFPTKVEAAPRAGEFGWVRLFFWFFSLLCFLAFFFRLAGSTLFFSHCTRGEREGGEERRPSERGQEHSESRARKEGA